MPRVRDERWANVGFAVEKGEQQRVSPEGLPMMKPDGTPDTEPVTILVFVHNLSDGQWIIRVPFEDSSRLKLIDALTGGIVVAKAGDIGKINL
jgi:hypothetical protein